MIQFITMPRSLHNDSIYTSRVVIDVDIRYLHKDIPSHFLWLKLSNLNQY